MGRAIKGRCFNAKRLGTRPSEVAVDARDAAKTESTTDHHFPNGFTRQQVGAAISGRRQEIIILPTERCNLRCSYCYEDFAIGKMTAATQRAVERFIEQRVRGLEVLSLSWFGGEPLVAHDVVLRLSTFAKAVCDAHGVSFSGGITTNGYLLSKSVFQQLIDLEQNFFQITLDGWGDVHNAVRKFRDGRGTFDRIWSNLQQIKGVSGDFDILLRIHVRRENVDQLLELMRETGSAFGDDARFRLDFQHVRNLGGPGGASLKEPIQLREMFEIEKALRAEYARHATRDNRPTSVVEERAIERSFAQKMTAESAGAQRADEVSFDNYICYAAKPNSILIRANGRIGKCTVAFYDERNDIGRLLSDGRIEIDNDKLRPWMRGLATFDIESLACPLKSMPRTAKSATRSA